MNWSFSELTWDSEQQRPAVTVTPLVAPGSVQVRFDSLGTTDEQADTMFVVTDEHEDIKEIWRPEVMHIVLLRRAIEQESFTLICEDRDTYTRTVRLGDTECERLRGVVRDLSESNSPLMLTDPDR